LPRHRYKTDFTEDYARFKSRFDRDYAERAQKVEPSGMLREAEPDYEMHIKPYKAEKPAEPWSALPEPQQEKIEPEQMKELIEPTESTPVEDLELEIRPADYLEKRVEGPVEKPLDYAEPKKSDAEPAKSNGY